MCMCIKLAVVQLVPHRNQLEFSNYINSHVLEPVEVCTKIKIVIELPDKSLNVMDPSDL